MEHVVLLVLIFGTIALARHTAQHKLALHSIPYAGLLAHPALLDTVRDVSIHTLVYSGFSPLHWF